MFCIRRVFVLHLNLLGEITVNAISVISYLIIVILWFNFRFDAKTIILKQYLKQEIDTCTFLIIRVVQEKPQFVILQGVFNIIPLRGNLYLLRTYELRMATCII